MDLSGATFVWWRCLLVPDFLNWMWGLGEKKWQQQKVEWQTINSKSSMEWPEVFENAYQGRMHNCTVALVFNIYHVHLLCVCHYTTCHMPANTASNTSAQVQDSGMLFLYVKSFLFLCKHDGLMMETDFRYSPTIISALNYLTPMSLGSLGLWCLVLEIAIGKSNKFHKKQ